MRIILTVIGCLILSCGLSDAAQLSANGYASWYGESHRGRLMANGEKFDPGKLTAASWFYPLGTRVRVTLYSGHNRSHHRGLHSVMVTITDRGPATRLVNDGRIIDLAQAAFERLAPGKLGLIPIKVNPIP